MTVKCPYCDSDDSYDKIGIHWTNSACPGPQLNSRQRQIIHGLLLGGAEVVEPEGAGKNVSIRVNTDRDAFIDWLEEEFGPLMRENKWSAETRKSAVFNKYADLEPEDLMETPLVLRVWYALGGTSFIDDGKWQLELSAPNSVATPQYIRDELMKGTDIPWEAKPDMENPRVIVEGEDHVKNILESLGPPIPGYEYRWFPKVDRQSWDEQYEE